MLLAVMLLLSGILFYALYYQEADRYEIARSEVDRSRLGLWDVLKKPVMESLIIGSFIQSAEFLSGRDNPE